MDHLVFDIALDQKFPFSAPQVFLASELGVHFELNDGRGSLGSHRPARIGNEAEVVHTHPPQARR